MEKSNVLLYITFKKYPELGRLKVVNDASNNAEEVCDNCIGYVEQDSYCRILNTACIKYDIHYEKA
jgi:hypothetical protein